MDQFFDLPPDFDEHNKKWAEMLKAEKEIVRGIRRLERIGFLKPTMQIMSGKYNFSLSINKTPLTQRIKKKITE